MKGIAVVGALVALLAACSATRGGGPTPDVQTQAAQAYQAAANAFDQTNNAVGATLTALPSGAPWSDTVAPAQESLTATEAFEKAVSAIHFPAQDQADASALLKDVELDISDLQAVVAEPSDATWMSYAGDNAATAGDANALRTELGLPPAPTS